MSLENASDRYQMLSVAPLQIKPMILSKIDEQIKLARAGKPNGLMFKTNSVTDKDIIDKIAEASQAGVHTTLFVRGISCLVPGVEGYTDNVKVVSIVGRLLEHSRIYGFGPRDNREIYLSSADLMTRNMEKRVEIAWPIINPELKEKVNEYLDISLSDTAKLRMLKNDLTYTPLEFFAAEGPDGIPESFDSQEYLIKKAREDYLHSLEIREEQAAQRSATARVQRIRDLEIRAAAPVVETLGESAQTETGTVQASEAPTEETQVEIPQETVQVSDSTATAATETTASTESETPTEPAAATETEISVSNTSSATPENVGAAGGIEEVEPGVAGPAPAAANTTDTDSAQSTTTSTSTASATTAAPSPEVTVVPPEQQQTSNAGTIQLVQKKPSLWTRIKFLFTGKL